MKRSLAILAFSAVCAVPATAVAQTQIGLKAGVAWANVDNHGVSPGPLTGRTGFTAGLSFGTGLSPIGLGAEILYARRGFSGPDDNSSRRLDFVDIPIYARVMVPTQGFAPYFIIGPQVSWELNCVAGDDDCGDAGNRNPSYAGIIGAGARIGNEGSMTIEGRYMYGLSNLRYSTVSTSDSYRSRGFLVLVGIGF